MASYKNEQNAPNPIRFDLIRTSYLSDKATTNDFGLATYFETARGTPTLHETHVFPTAF